MRSFSRAAGAAALFFSVVAPASADDGAGAYLAGRSAMLDNHFVDASRYFSRALRAAPENVEMMESATLAYIASANFDNALAMARRLNAIDDESQLGRLMLGSAAVINGNFDEAFEIFDDPSVGPLISSLGVAWATAGQGNMSDAITAFQAVADESGLRDFGLYHKGLALLLVGDFEGADEVLGGDILATKRLSLAHAGALATLERTQDALDVLDRYLAFENDPDVMAARAQIAAGQLPNETIVRSVQDGVAEIFYGLANALEGEADDVFTLAYSRIAEYLRPDHVDASLLSAGILEDLGQFDLATSTYDRIGRDHPAFFEAEIGRAAALASAEKPDQAIEVLRQLGETHADQPAVHSRLGDTLRREQRYDEASKAYDRAIALTEGTAAEFWFTYYTRGITHERMDRWPLAEADFRKALELNPDQPQVLNYIGYSFVELQINLDEALDMIRRAVDARPNDGYITDSLGWVHYRLGNFEEAVIWMEKAAALMPVDPVINDHLGDTYWAVGRKREARFQWNRAMSFDPEEEDAERIRRKLAVGLDIVLEEEGAAPLTHADGG